MLEVLLQESVSVGLRFFQQLLSYLRRTNDLFVGEMLHKEKLSVVGEVASSLMLDLRNPLTGIRLSADLMSEKDSGNPDTARCCDGIRFQCDRVMAMTRDLLQFSKGDSCLHPGQTTTTAFLNHFQSLHEDYFRQTGLFWEIISEPAAIEIDEMRCLRLLQNLVTNAVEALNGNANGQIHIRGWVEDSMFNLSKIVYCLSLALFRTIGTKAYSGTRFHDHNAILSGCARPIWPWRSIDQKESPLFKIRRF